MVRGGGPRAAADNPCDVFPQLDGALAEWMREQRKLEPALTCEHFEKAAAWTPPVLAATPVSSARDLLARSPPPLLSRTRSVELTC